MQSLQNKKVLVIGGSSGIGKAVAAMAHQLHASVTITSRNLEKAKTVAAGNTHSGNLLEGNLSDHMHAFQERLVGSLRIVKSTIPNMKEGGSITFTGGVSTDRPIAGAWVTGLGTASAEQLARVLVMEFPTIRFNAVSPGYTDTPMWDGIMGANKEAILAGIAETLPVKKIATPEEVAAAVIFLMSNASVTGEVIHVDGGARLI